MATQELRYFFNFEEVATNVLALVELMVNTRSFYIAYTDSEVVTILKMRDRVRGMVETNVFTMPIEHSY
ncbi:hypothetical protein [Tumebacillus flagellatus]|uniref:Uncharacterized protein n=1 Tax=Tumebacillus flagellatus TaxID=1157490 RepID=A0A074LQ62_9BACL|nr:hypothetical protein [Tumebacillus flagellatus]KEO84286.1 hypothetical protein EL26_05835 [Tumebacillus flagellatus]